MSATVHVEGISSRTTEDEVKSFFSFCGKIQSLSVTKADESSQKATVTFEKPAAAKTALLLDNTQLGPNSVHVTASPTIDDIAGEKAASADQAKDGDTHLEQEEKPRSRIIAEYLAHGYVISDKAIERALALDQQHGYSQTFTNTLKAWDQRFHATERAQAVDTKFGLTEKAQAGWRSLASYFDKATETPTGQKLRAFYDQGNKTVVDVHNEARHLANLKSDKQTSTETETGTSNEKPTGGAPTGGASTGVNATGISQVEGDEKAAVSLPQK